MSNFPYNLLKADQKEGVWLRPYAAYNEDIMLAIKRSKLKRFTDTVQRIIIRSEKHESPEMQEYVLLQIWCKSLIDSIRGKNRYNVFNIWIKENPNWTCEGDLGKGANLNF